MAHEKPPFRVDCYLSWFLFLPSAWARCFRTIFVLFSCYFLTRLRRPSMEVHPEGLNTGSPAPPSRTLLFQYHGQTFNVLHLLLLLLWPRYSFTSFASKPKISLIFKQDIVCCLSLSVIRKILPSHICPKRCDASICVDVG